jgi:hypothetical protein
MNSDWDVVGSQDTLPTTAKLNSEEQEAILRSKAMLIIAKRGYTRYVWERVMKRLIKCIKLG